MGAHHQCVRSLGLHVSLSKSCTMLRRAALFGGRFIDLLIVTTPIHANSCVYLKYSCDVVIVRETLLLLEKKTSWVVQVFPSLASSHVFWDHRAVGVGLFWVLIKAVHPLFGVGLVSHPREKLMNLSSLFDSLLRFWSRELGEKTRVTHRQDAGKLTWRVFIFGTFAFCKNKNVFIFSAINQYNSDFRGQIAFERRIYFYGFLLVIPTSFASNLVL